MTDRLVDNQMILGVALIIASFPLRNLSNAYFRGFGDESGFIASMLFYVLLFLGGALIFFSFFRWRVARVRAARGD